MSENHNKKMDESILSGRLFGAIPALLDNLPAGFAIMQVLLDEDDNPYDFVYKYANNVYAYLEDVSLEDLMEWTWGRLFPDAGEKLLGAFANIALNGGSRVIEELDHSRKKKTQIICYQPVYGYCACVVQELDIPDAVDVPIEEHVKPEIPVPKAPSTEAENVQPKIQSQVEAEPQAEIPPMAALREETQTLPVEEPQPEEIEEPQAVIPPMAALQTIETEEKPMEAETLQAEPKPAEAEAPQAEIKPMEVEAQQAELKPAEAEAPQAEIKPMEVEVPQAEPKPAEAETPQAEMKPVEVEVPQAEPKPAEAEAPQAEMKPIEIHVPQPEVQPSDEAAGELAMFADADDADMEEAADDVQMIEVEVFEPIAPDDTADAFTAVDASVEPVAVEQDIEKGLASLERLGDVPVEAETQEEISDGSSVSIMDILEGSKNQGTAQDKEADIQGDTYDAPGQNVSIADIAAAAAGQQGTAPAGLQQVEAEVPSQPQQEAVSQPEQAPQEEVPQQAQPQEEPAQAEPQQESAGAPGNINLEVPEEKSFGGHIAEVISDLNHLDDFSAIMKLEDLMQSAQPQQAESVTKAKQMIECSMFEEAKDLLRTLL